MSKFEDYYGYVRAEAETLVDENWDGLKYECVHHSFELYEFFDRIVHEHVDNDFIYVDLMDSAYILERLNNVETDSGLWEGQEPMEAINTQAFFTYRLDLMGEVIEEARNFLSEYADELEVDMDNKQDEINDKQAEIDELKDDEDMDDEDKEVELNRLEQELGQLEEDFEELANTRDNALETIRMSRGGLK